MHAVNLTFPRHSSVYIQWHNIFSPRTHSPLHPDAPVYHAPVHTL